MTDGLSEAYDMKKWDVFCENNDLLLENDQLKAENEKLRELAKEACEQARVFYDCGGTFNDLDDLLCEASELGIEVSA